jgi:hypothetical protein
LFWSVDRLGRSTAAVTAALEELDAAGVAIYADKEAMDTSTPHGRAMLQMAAVFAELERAMIRERVNAGLARARAQGKRLGRPKFGMEKDHEAREKRETQAAAIRSRLAAGVGIGKITRELGVGSSTVQRIRREMAEACGQPGAPADYAAPQTARPGASDASGRKGCFADNTPPPPKSTGGRGEGWIFQASCSSAARAPPD